MGLDVSQKDRLKRMKVQNMRDKSWDIQILVISIDQT